MKILSLIFLFFFASAVFAVNVSREPIEVFFVPGFNTGEDSTRDDSIARLKLAFPDAKVTVKPWKAGKEASLFQKALIYPEVVRRSEDQAMKLVAEIMRMNKDEQQHLILTGHSLGGRVVVITLSELAARGIKIHSAMLFGAAIFHDDPRIYQALDAVRFYCVNIFCPSDDTLLLGEMMENLKQRRPYLGRMGWNGKDARFKEWHLSDVEFFDLNNHFAYNYLGGIHELIRQLDFEMIDDDIEVTQDKTNEIRIPADNIFWEDIDSFSGWKLQQSCFGEFRIIDRAGFRRAIGSESKMKSAFADIKSKLAM